MKITLTRINLLCVCFMAIGLIFVVNSSAIIDFDNCVGLWLFDEADGNTAKDLSGKDNNGTIHGGATFVDGKFGNGLNLDGTDDYVEIAHDESLNVGGEHTIALWFKLHNAPAAGMGVVTKDDWAP